MKINKFALYFFLTPPKKFKKVVNENWYTCFIYVYREYKNVLCVEIEINMQRDICADIEKLVGEKKSLLNNTLRLLLSNLTSP